MASIAYVNDKMGAPQISLSSMCMGANATLNAIEKQPEAFKNVKSLLCIAPLKGRTTIERQAEQMGIAPNDAIETFEPIYKGITGLEVADHNIIPKFKNLNIPTFFFQVRDDPNSRWTDVQEMYDITPTEDKKIVYMEGTPLRFKGYNYFSDNPEEMIAWFDEHMK